MSSSRLSDAVYCNAVLVQVRASEIIPSTAYASECTLRFPRVVAMRDDKKYIDALDMEQLQHIRSLSDGELVLPRPTSFVEMYMAPLDDNTAAFPRSKAGVDDVYMLVGLTYVNAIYVVALVASYQVKIVFLSWCAHSAFSCALLSPDFSIFSR